MQNFTYLNPTKILFGKGQIANINAEIPVDAKVMMIYGGGSIKRNGVYDQVMNALEGREVLEFSGIEPNPRYDTLMKAVERVKAEDITYLLAVGGGSVIDGVKFVAAAAKFGDGDPWDILAKNAEVKRAMPVGAVLTLAATGTEMNGTSVVTRGHDKRAFNSVLVNPQFSVLDPEVTYSLPVHQISNGIVDSFVHVVEQYLTYPVGGHLQDRFAEGILQTLIEVGPKTLASPEDYDARASFMWCTTMALNGLIAQGVPSDWATHMIGHELTALYGLDHAMTLAIVLPNVMNVQREQKRKKLLQYAERVWGVIEGDEDARIDAAITKTREFFELVGVPTRLSDYKLGETAVDEVMEHIQTLNILPLGEHQDMDVLTVKKVLEAAL